MLARGNWFHSLGRHGYVVLHLGVRGTDRSAGTVGMSTSPRSSWTATMLSSGWRSSHGATGTSV